MFTLARPRVRFGVSLAAVVALLLAVAVARAAFSAPVNLSAPGYDATSYEVTSDGDGDAVAVWQRDSDSDSRIQARSISSNGVLGPTQTLSGGGGSDPDIASNADGDAVAVWAWAHNNSHQIQARSSSSTGALGPTRTVTGPDFASAPQVAVDADGDALVVWQRPWGNGYIVQARSISSAGVLGPVETLSVAGQWDDDPQVATDADGDSVVVWNHSEGSSRWIQEQAVSSSGARGPLQDLSLPAAPGGTADPHVSVNADGAAVAVWSRRWRVSRSHRSTLGLAHRRPRADPEFVRHRPAVQRTGGRHR